MVKRGNFEKAICLCKRFLYSALWFSICISQRRDDQKEIFPLEDRWSAKCEEAMSDSQRTRSLWRQSEIRSAHTFKEFFGLLQPSHQTLSRNLIQGKGLWKWICTVHQAVQGNRLAVPESCFRAGLIRRYNDWPKSVPYFLSDHSGDLLSLFETYLRCSPSPERFRRSSLWVSGRQPTEAWTH